jgi:putative transposase
MTRPWQREKMAATGPLTRWAGIALAWRTCGVSEGWQRSGPKLGGRAEDIADLPIGLTNARNTWGFGLCISYLRNV